jgi:cytochrome c-type biogenesis protein CcmF
VGPAFLVFLALMMTVAVVLLFRRLALLESRHTADELVSKESTFLLNNLLFCGIAFTVFLGTVFPLAAEALRGTKLSIQAPFFNAITAPLGVALMALIGVCTLIAWRQSSLAFLGRNLRIPLGVGVLAGAAGPLLGVQSVGAAIVFAAAGFTAAVLVLDAWRAIRVRARQQGIAFGPAIVDTVLRNQQRFGGIVIHLGVVFLFVGLAGNLFKSEHTLTIQPGHAATVGGYQLLFKGVREEPFSRNAKLRLAELEVYSGTRLVDTLKPGRSYYPTQPDPLNEVAIHRTVQEDLYVVLAGENPDGSVTIRVNLNPLVMVAWFAFPLFTLGAGLAMFYQPRRLPEPLLSRNWSLA